MKGEQLISVIMPAYNAAGFIAESIKSVQEQTYTYWELIIIDDGSTDNTAAIIKLIAANDDRIQYYFKNNSGQGAARNLGIKKSKGDFIAFLDADDKWFAHKLQHQIVFMEHTKADVVFADIDLLNNDMVNTSFKWVKENVVYKGNEGLKAFLENNRIPFVSAFVKKETILSVNGFEEINGMQYGEDYDLWIRMLQKGYTLAGSEEKLALYRKHGAQSTANVKAMLQVIKRLHALELCSKELNETKNKSISIWIRRFIKNAKADIRKDELAAIINCLPVYKRKLFLLLSTFGNSRLVSKLIFLSCRSSVLKMSGYGK